MNREDQETLEAVDRLLFEQGTYTPLELLLSEGRLIYADYEAWRDRQCDYLEELLFGNPEESIDLMKRAEAYVRALGLVPETQCYASGSDAQGHRLRFSATSALDRCFHTGYRKDDESPQMDLLMDTAGVTIGNGIIRALIERNEDEARQLLDQLFETDPGHRHLGGLERLVEVGNIESPIEDAGRELLGLEGQICPLAEEILGPGARHYLAPLWQRLTRALLEVAFDPDNPKLHSSYSALRSEDWVQAKASVEATSNWEDQFVLLRRHARACGRLHLNPEAVSDWFRLCWRFPDQAACIGNEAEPQCRHTWQRFVELDPELPNRDFPAWTLIDQPGLARRLAKEGSFDGVDVPQDYRVIASLVQATPTPLVDPEIMDKRKLLQECNPDLFAVYLQSVKAKTCA